jgi:hypothetical protein
MTGAYEMKQTAGFRNGAGKKSDWDDQKTRRQIRMSSSGSSRTTTHEPPLKREWHE